jgi:Bacterial PH domain
VTARSRALAPHDRHQRGEILGGGERSAIPAKGITVGALDRYFKTPTVEERLRRAGVREDLVQAAGRTAFGRPGDPGLFDLPSYLSEDETVLQLMEGRAAGGAVGILLLTSHRLLFVPDGRRNLTAIPVTDIQAVDAQVKRSMSRIEISTADTTLTFDRILGNQGATLAANIQKVLAPSPDTPTRDALEELGELRALHDAGLVDDQEYESRKRALIEKI